MNNNAVKSILIKLLFLFSQFGIFPLQTLRALKGLPAYFRDLYEFKIMYKGAISIMPCLLDRYEEGGVTKSEYFWQDLVVARWIYEAKPTKHVDVGSRIDGFVAHVASFRDLEVIDVRPISSNIPGINFIQADLLMPNLISRFSKNGGYCDSISCLHVLEHFGLGRYGGNIDSSGFKRGFDNLATLLQPKGTLYLGTPLGRERVEFNANWVFAPQTILDLASANELRLEMFLVFNNKTGLLKIELEELESSLELIKNDTYNLGIMKFVKAG